VKTHSKKDAPEYQYTVEMNLYKGHFFLEEKTEIFSYYINHIDTEPFAKRLYHENSEGRNSRPNDPARYIKSGMLVRKLLEQDKFIPITFGEFSVLKTTFFSELKEVECALDFNPNFCTRLLEPGKEKKAVVSVNVWFADFESDPDVNKTEHIPFMVVIYNAITSNQHMVFKGKDCGRQLLEYVPKKLPHLLPQSWIRYTFSGSVRNLWRN
jgi:hypothetical protein